MLNTSAPTRVRFATIAFADTAKPVFDFKTFAAAESGVASAPDPAGELKVCVYICS